MFNDSHGLKINYPDQKYYWKKQRDQIHFIKLLPQDVGIIQANYIGGVIQISIQFFDCISLKRLAVRRNSKEPSPSVYSISGSAAAEQMNLIFAS